MCEGGNINTMENIMVSVICLTYNHKNYIEQCLRGFINQKTDFPVEVLVHDDCSTDGTTVLVRQYEQKYPDLIKGVYEQENQYSKGIRITLDLMLPLAKGKYIAFCEGDDYWIDESKLQMQVDFMEAHQECTLCFTNGECHENGTFVKNVIPWREWNRPVFESGKTEFNLGEMAMLDFVPTNSLLFPRTIAMKMREVPSNIFQGDALYRLFLTNEGYAHYIDKATCVYNAAVVNSATDRWKKDSALKARVYLRLANLMDYMDHKSGGKYTKELEYVKYRDLWTYSFTVWDFQSVKPWRYMKYARKNGFKHMIHHILATRCCCLYTLIIKNRT